MVKKKEIQKREKERKQQLKESLEYNQSITSIIFTIGIVVVLFLTFYFITSLVVNKMDKFKYKPKEATNTKIQYEEILAGTIFNQNEEEYYVLFFDFDGPYASYYEVLSRTSEHKVYLVDLGKSFNTPYVSENTNSKANDYSSLKVKDCTIIKIKNGKNVFYYEGEYEDIKDKLK